MKRTCIYCEKYKKRPRNNPSLKQYDCMLWKNEERDPFAWGCNDFTKITLSRKKLQGIINYQTSKLISEIKQMVEVPQKIIPLKYAEWYKKKKEELRKHKIPIKLKPLKEVVIKRHYIDFLNAKNLKELQRYDWVSFIDENDFKKHQPKLKGFADRFLLKGEKPLQGDLEYINYIIGKNVYPRFEKALFNKKERINMVFSGSEKWIAYLYFELMIDVLEYRNIKRCIVCGRLTSRPKYCSDKCGNLARINTHREKNKK